MYITGSYNNFENRLHQLPTGISDLNTFKLEGRTYFNSVSTGDGNTFNTKWNKEFVKKAAQYETITGSVFS